MFLFLIEEMENGRLLIHLPLSRFSDSDLELCVKFILLSVNVSCFLPLKDSRNFNARGCLT